ncbi:MAG: hypothetical protein Q4C41_07075 [Eggerthellaceae bacterium]|nr:hypothetical protein [Eggerthellaceae bacterium]
MSNIERSEFYGSLQRIVDALFYDLEAEGAGAQGASGGAPSAAERLGVSPRTASLLGLSAFDAPAPEPAPEPASPTVRRLDVVIAAEAADLPEELMRIVNLLPPGNYTRQRLCDQINSAITGHAWGQVYGTVS